MGTSSTISSVIILAPGFAFGIEPTKEMEYKKVAREVGFKKIFLIVRGNQEILTKYLFLHLLHFGFYILTDRLVFKMVSLSSHSLFLSVNHNFILSNGSVKYFVFQRY